MGNYLMGQNMCKVCCGIAILVFASNLLYLSTREQGYINLRYENRAQNLTFPEAAVELASDGEGKYGSDPPNKGDFSKSPSLTSGANQNTPFSSSPITSSPTTVSNNAIKEKSALCIVGNIRTFPLTFDSLENFAVDNGLDVYMVLQKGHAVGSTWLKYKPEDFGSDMEDAMIEKLTESLKNSETSKLRMEIKDMKIVQNGNCAEYSKYYAGTSIFGQHCRDTPTHSQIRWTRTCFDMVLRSGIQYKKIIRTRPDIGMFQPINLNDYNENVMYASWKAGAPVVGGDWFYFLPFHRLIDWWSQVELTARGNTQQHPNPDFFLFKRIRTYCMQFPVVIVRGPRFAECCRFDEDRRHKGVTQGGSGSSAKCEVALKKGSFERLTKLLAQNPEVKSSGDYRTCNLRRGYFGWWW